MNITKHLEVIWEKINKSDYISTKHCCVAQVENTNDKLEKIFSTYIIHIRCRLSINKQKKDTRQFTEEMKTKNT